VGEIRDGLTTALNPEQSGFGKRPDSERLMPAPVELLI
jgi:hypothetical protein